MKQFFTRKGKLFPPYVFAFIFLTGVSLLLILIVVNALYIFYSTRVLVVTITDLAMLLGTTATWMGFYKWTDDKQQEKERYNELSE